MLESLFLSYFLYILYRLVAHLVMILSLPLSLSLYLDMYMHMHTHTHTRSLSRSVFDMDWAFVCFLFALSPSLIGLYMASFICHCRCERNIPERFVDWFYFVIDTRPYIRQDLIYHVEVGQTPFLYFLVTSHRKPVPSTRSTPEVGHLQELLDPGIPCVDWTGRHSRPLASQS